MNQFDMIHVHPIGKWSCQYDELPSIIKQFIKIGEPLLYILPDSSAIFNFSPDNVVTAQTFI